MTAGIAYGICILLAVLCLVGCGVSLASDLRGPGGMTEHDVQAQLYGRADR